MNSSLYQWVYKIGEFDKWQISIYLMTESEAFLLFRNYYDYRKLDEVLNGEN